LDDGKGVTYGAAEKNTTIGHTLQQHPWLARCEVFILHAKACQKLQDEGVNVSVCHGTFGADVFI
jgi:hypothetical protein